MRKLLLLYSMSLFLCEGHVFATNSSASLQEQAIINSIIKDVKKSNISKMTSLLTRIKTSYGSNFINTILLAILESNIKNEKILITVVKLLLKKGANPYLKSSSSAYTPLELAAKTGREAIIKLMLEHSTSSKNSNFGDALHYAAINGYINIVQYLVGKGADVNGKNKSGELLLVNILKNSIIKNESLYIQMITFLISSGANPYLKVSSSSYNPLELAAQKGFGSIVKSMLGYNNRSPDFGDALHYATINGYVNIIELLIDHGANINGKSRSGNTVLLNLLESTAIKSENLRNEIFRLLLHRGADLSMKGISSLMPLELAASKGYEGIVKIMIEHLKKSKNLNFGKALQYAKNSKIVQYLINSGAKANLK